MTEFIPFIEERRTAPTTLPAYSQTKPTNLGSWDCMYIHHHHSVFTHPKGERWCSFYHPTERKRLRPSITCTVVSHMIPLDH